MCRSRAAYGSPPLGRCCMLRHHGWSSGTIHQHNVHGCCIRLGGILGLSAEAKHLCVGGGGICPDTCDGRVSRCCYDPGLGWFRQCHDFWPFGLARKRFGPSARASCRLTPFNFLTGPPPGRPAAQAGTRSRGMCFGTGSLGGRASSSAEDPLIMPGRGSLCPKCVRRTADLC